MSNHVKAINSAALALVGIFLLAGLTWTQRVDLKRDLQASEQAVAGLLLSAQGSSDGTTWSKDSQTVVSHNNPENFYDDWTGTFEQRRRAGASEVDALGHLMTYAPWLVFRRVPVPSGGWAEYATRPTDVTTYSGTCSDDQPPAGEPDAAPTAKNEEEVALPFEAPPSPSQHRGATAIFRLGIDVRASSALLFAPFKLEFTNRIESFRPDTLDICNAIGATSIGTLLHNRVSWRTRAETTADMLTVGRKWGVPAQRPADVYASLRVRYEQQTVRLPIFGIDVRADLALRFLALIATALAAMTSWHSYELTRFAWHQDAHAERHPLLSPRSISARDQRATRRLIAWFEGGAICLFYVLGVITSLAVVILACIEDSEQRWLAVLLGFFCTLFVLSILRNLVYVWRSSSTEMGNSNASPKSVEKGGATA